MALWHRAATIEQLNATRDGTLLEALDIRFVEIGEDHVSASMPVDQRTHQPYGLLHGGASVALAETVGSTASGMALEDGWLCVGLEINANHLRAVRSGLVVATARAIHIGRRTHVWDIRIENDARKAVCVARLTTAIIAADSLK